MKKYLLLILIFLSFFSYSQTLGGKKREKARTARRILFNKSPKTSPWIYRKTEPGPIQNREMFKLFKRHRTNGRKEYDKILERQNKLRSKRRIRGNDFFQKRKYF